MRLGREQHKCTAEKAKQGPRGTSPREKKTHGRNKRKKKDIKKGPKEVNWRRQDQKRRDKNLSDQREKRGTRTFSWNAIRKEGPNSGRHQEQSGSGGGINTEQKFPGRPICQWNHTGTPNTKHRDLREGEGQYSFGQTWGPRKKQLENLWCVVGEWGGKPGS